MKFRSLVLLVAILGVTAMAVRPAFDTDTWWHLRAGQWIVEHRQVPRVDPFSSTMAGSPWAYPGWLAQVLLFGSFRVGGLAGLTIFSAVLVGVAFLFVWPLLEGPLGLRVSVLLLAAATSAVYWAARPHIASFALAAVYLWTLEQGRRTRPRLVWLLPVLMVLWVNLHGGFAIGFILVIMHFGGALLDVCAAALSHSATWGEAWHSRRSEIATLGGVFLLCLAASALNPYGPAILGYPFKTVSIPVLQSLIQEWQPPDLRSPQLLPFLAMLLCLIVAFGVSRRSAGATELLTAAGWTALALLAVRNVPIFALVAAPVIARHASAVLQGLASGPPSAASGEERRRLNAALAVGFALIGLAWAVLQLSPERTEAQLREQVPVAAVAAMRDLAPEGALFNDYNWGGYVLWQLYPEYTTFVDGRTDVFSVEVFDDYLRLWTAQDGWESAVERWDIGTALLPTESPLVAALKQAGWDERFRDGQAVVLTRPVSG